ncbi:hypothetical protein EMIHUDRAFT_228100 [Emiliania huxleyi CCMP1516]|uniref:Kinesin-associated protein 3 n=2 Tax=Emiliania huxleyi TaxID=2903 RepID=A0A0D3KGF0_EMIH1|nr:hypothetical protein EMIHUDRAFT_228100 [Emiliania huxleyi CCMP1516]EOD34835.1 hypothetical protein EMIHUDRAFT_228100 [Emiliania huxleyi CCMP1516]|eukprot:XP_005787264.1 hypothetical protein EMIHUDRAFT_228100 [Emiliania huxleyi CCMP1516]
MAKKGLTPLLASILKRDNSELRVLALAFLKKLAENLPALRDASLLAGVAAACGSSSSEELPLTALRVVYNLSFDPHARKAIFASPVLSKLAVLIRRRSHPLVLRILYLLSVEQRGREATPALAKTDVPVSLRKHVLACSDAQLPAELAGLAINLATASRAADALAAEGGMRHLLERLLQTHDLVLLKLIRALVAHDGPASAAAPLTAELLGLTRQVVDDEHMRLELLGTLSGLRLARLPDLPRLVERYSLIELLRQHMAPGAAQDDALLEAVVLAGELAGSAKVAVMLLSSGLVFRDSMAGGPTTRTLYSLLTERQEDDEFVVQLLFAFYRLLQVEEPRVALLEKTQMVVYLLDLLLDRNSAVCGLASQCLDAISESDEDWAAQIRQRKFEAHNHEWLAVVDEDEAEEYQDALALNNAVKSLRENAPLDASLLGKGGYLEAGETLRPGHSPASDCSSPMDEYGVGHGMHGLGSYGYGLDEYDEEDYVA